MADPGDGLEAAAFLAEVMDRLGIGQADLVGASYGGWAAMNLAVHRPARVGRVRCCRTSRCWCCPGSGTSSVSSGARW